MGILSFNWYGYQLLSNYWQARSNHRLEANLDNNNYDASQLITLKVPVTSLSYYNSSTSFERVDGQITIGGTEYKYVERRIFKDSMEYRCIPNRTAMNLKKATNEFFQLVNDLSHNGQEKKTPHNSVNKSISQDYCANEQTTLLPAPGIIVSLQKAMPVAAHLPSSYTPTAERPPDSAMA